MSEAAIIIVLGAGSFVLGWASGYARGLDRGHGAGWESAVREARAQGLNFDGKGIFAERFARGFKPPD